MLFLRQFLSFLILTAISRVVSCARIGKHSSSHAQWTQKEDLLNGRLQFKEQFPATTTTSEESLESIRILAQLAAVIDTGVHSTSSPPPPEESTTAKTQVPSTTSTEPPATSTASSGNATNAPPAPQPAVPPAYHPPLVLATFNSTSSNTTSTTTTEATTTTTTVRTSLALEHTEFVLHRLRFLDRAIPSNITELRALQQAEFENNTIYKEAWEKAVELFETKKERIHVTLEEEVANHSSCWNLSSTLSATVPDEYHIALIAYTLGWPAVYADFNRQTKELCSGFDITKYPYKSFFKLLTLAIETLNKEPKYRRGPPHLYRGIHLLLNVTVGQIVAFQHFISTSVSLSVAENFAWRGGVLEIGGNITNALSLDHHSAFVSEEEVLLSPINVFRVEAIHKGSYNTRYVLAKVEEDEGYLRGSMPENVGKVQVVERQGGGGGSWEVTYLDYTSGCQGELVNLSLSVLLLSLFLASWNT